MKLLLLPLLLCATACGSVTPAGLVAASRLDPLGTPPADVAVALAVPGALRLAEGDATLRLAFQPEGASAPTVDVTLPLDARSVADGLPVDPGTRVLTASLPAEAHASFAAAQAEIAALRADGVRGQGRLSIDVTGGCLTAPLGNAFPISTWLRGTEDGAFVPLTRRTDAGDLLASEPYAALRARLAPC